MAGAAGEGSLAYAADQVNSAEPQPLEMTAAKTVKVSKASQFEWSYMEGNAGKGIYINGIKSFKESNNYNVVIPAKISGKKVIHVALNEKNIVSLNVKKAIYLKELWVPDNKIKSLDVKSNTKLITLSVARNPLKALNVTKNKKLVVLDFHDTKVKSIDLSGCTKILNFSSSFKLAKSKLPPKLKLERPVKHSNTYYNYSMGPVGVG